MKQLSKKLPLVLMVLVFAVVAIFGVTSFCMNSSNESVVANAESSSVSEDWFKINYSSTEIEILFNGSFREYLSANKGDIDTLISAFTSAAREIIAKSLFSNDTVSAAGELPFDPSDFDPADFDWNVTSVLSKFKDFVIDRLSDPNEFEKFVDGEYDVLIDYAIGNYISNQQGNEEEAYEKINIVMKDVVDQAYENAYETAKEELGEYFDETEWAEKKDHAHNKSDERVETVKDNGGKATISFKQLIQAFQSVYVNGWQLYSATNGLSMSTVRNIVAMIPRPCEIADMTSAELKKLVSAHLDIETTFGTVSFDLSLGFFGDTSLIKSAMKKIADHIDINVDGSDVNVKLLVPEAVSSAYTKFLNSSRFTTEQKNMVFSVFSKSAEEIFDYANDYSYQDVLDLLKSVDYKNWIANFVNANYINHYFGSYITPVLGHPLTNENIDKLINKVHNFFASKNWDYMTVETVENWLIANVPGMSRVTIPSQLEAVAQKLLNIAKKIDWDKYDADYVREICASSDYKVNETIYNYIDKLGSYENYYNKVIGYAEKLFAYIPESIKDTSIVDSYDGEKFVGSIDRVISISSIASRIAQSLNARGYDKLAKYVENIPVMLDRDYVHIDLTVEMTVPNIYKIEYVSGENVVREGFLPSGISYEVIESLSRLNSIEGYEILYWVDANTYEQITAMPASNLTLAPVTVFTVMASENVEAVYDVDKSYEIGFTVNGVTNATYSYEWYKNGVAYENNALTISVSNVSDSGEYYVVVTDNATGISVTSDTVVVNISAQEINFDVTQLKLKETEFVYTGSKVVVELVDNAILNTGFLPAVMDFKTKGDAVTQTNAGEYSLTYSFVLSDTENYILVGDTDITLTWNIAKATINVDSSVLELVESDYIYNGNPITVALVDGVLEASGYLQDTLTLVWDNSVMTQTNAGDYSTTLTVSLKDSDNYKLIENEVEVELSSKTLAWNIAKQVVVIDGIDVNETSFNYNGLSHEITLVDGCYDSNLLNITVSGTTEATDSGYYTVVYRFTLVDGDNYELSGRPTWSFDWSISPIHVSLGNIAIKENEFVYTGVQRRISLVSGCYNRAYFDFEVSGTTEATNAGEYQATYTFTLKDDVNYVVDGETVYTFDWAITPKIVAPPTTWNDTYSFVYGQKVKVAYNGIPASDRRYYTNVEYEYKKGDEVVDIYASDFAWNVGEYSVTVRFALLSSNYAVEGSNDTSWELSRNIIITPKHLDLTGATWIAEDNATYYFDKEYNVRLNLDEAINLTASERRLVKSMLVYTVNGNIQSEPLVFVNAGTYSISASFANANYTASSISSYEFTIAKRNVNVEIKWNDIVEFVENDGTITYYPLNVLVYAEGYKNYPLPSNIVKVEYSGCEASEVGSYTSKVTITLLDTENFVLVAENEYTKDWTISKKPVTPPDPPQPPVKEPFGEGHKFEQNGVAVEIVSGSILGDYSASVTESALELKDIEEQLKSLFSDKKFEIVNAYDIHFENEEGNEQTVSGKFKVTLPIPEKYINAKELAVIHIDDNGNVTVVKGAERIGNEMQFETDGFSVYAVISLETEIPWVLIICLIIIAVILIISIILTAILIKKKKAIDKAGEETEEPTKENEEPVEETVEEPVEETSPETDVKEEEPVEEETESEPETVVEETTEEPVEETVEEPIQEEVVEEPVVEDTTYQEVEEPTPVVEINVEPVAPIDVLPVVDLIVEDETRIVMDRSFTARLAQSSDIVKERYSDIKNYALSYRKVRARMSWSCDSINRGRMKVCKLVIKGKTLFIYAAVNCEELPVKYHAKPVGGKKYETTPTMLKVRSDRAVKYAKEIIDIVMNGYEVKKKKVYTPIDYVPEFKSDEELLESGLIKKKITKKKSTPWKK